jgi:transcriptional regulator with XRE-family HTH domain
MSEDSALIDRFLAAVGDLSTREAAGAAGVSQGSVAKWRRGDRSPLFPGTMRKLRDFVASVGRNAEGPPAAGPGRLDLRERLASAEADAKGNAVSLALAYDALAATIRAEASLVEARASEARAKALGEDAAGARIRSLASTQATPLEPLSEEEAQQLAARVAGLLRRARELESAEHQDRESEQPRRRDTA